MVHSNKTTNWFFGWTSPWHRTDPDTTQCSTVDQKEHRRHQVTHRNEYDPVHYNKNKDDPIQSTPMNIEMDPENTSPPRSLSSSSTISHSRRNTKGSVLDIFHRRKSNPASVMSIQQSSTIRPSSPTGCQEAYPAILSSSPSSLYTSVADSTPPLSTANTAVYHNSKSNCSPPSSSIEPIDTTSSPSFSLHQHRRFPFIHQHHPTEPINNNHHIGNMPQSIIPLSCPMTSSEEHYQHRSSLISTPHNAQISTQAPSSKRPQFYEALLKYGSPFSEHTVNMEDNLPPTTPTNAAKSRITLNHDLMKLALEGLFNSPLIPDQEGETQILQIGCGDGSWCIDCAKESPKWFVLGLDNKEGGDLISTSLARKVISFGGMAASPVMKQPAPSSNSSLSTLSSSSGGRRDNFLFMKSTLSLVESLKRLPDGCFDLVYGRLLALALPSQDYEALVSECWRVCKPGGFVEFTEMDMRIYENMGNSKLIKWMNQQVASAMKKKNLDSRLPRHLQDQFFQLLVDDQQDNSCRRQDSYQVNYTSLPLGVWGGRLGVLFRDDFYDALDALDIVTPMDRYGNALVDEEWQTKMDMLDDELDSQKAFMNLYQIFVQKKKL
ncbi:unnamed protein product [Absidia cylindrospora]